MNDTKNNEQWKQIPPENNTEKTQESTKISVSQNNELGLQTQLFSLFLLYMLTLFQTN